MHRSRGRKNKSKKKPLLTKKEEEFNKWLTHVMREENIKELPDNHMHRRRKTMSASKKGAFCLECDWWNDLKNQSSVEPALMLLKQIFSKFNYIHRNIGTRSELFYYLKKWVQSAHSNYPVLYLAVHGSKGMIYFGDQRSNENKIALSELEDYLKGKCSGRIIHFGSCSTLDLHGNRIRRFIKETKALAVCGYKEDIDWLESTSLDLLFFNQVQMRPLTVKGANAIIDTLKSEVGPLVKKLGFHMVVR